MIYVLSGGGTGKLFAAIGVTYPAGSTCTCTNGTKTFTAKNTTGQWVFAIPEAGTWTVTSTDGTSSKSQSVSITSEGQWESVTLNYRYYLFDNGAIVPWTVGWYKEGYATCSVGNTITGTTSSGQTYTGWNIITEEMVDISGYSKLGINVTGENFSANYFGVSTTDTDGQVEWSEGDYAAYAEISTTGEIMCDISSVGNTSCRIGIGRDCWKKTASKLTVDKVWLE